MFKNSNAMPHAGTIALALFDRGTIVGATLFKRVDRVLLRGRATFEHVCEVAPALKLRGKVRANDVIGAKILAAEISREAAKDRTYPPDGRGD